MAGNCNSLGSGADIIITKSVTNILSHLTLVGTKQRAVLAHFLVSSMGTSNSTTSRLERIAPQM